MKLLKIQQYNEISRAEYPKWNGWRIIDFYDTINIKLELNSNEYNIILILEENLSLIRELEKIFK